MIDITWKRTAKRTAKAEGMVYCLPETARRILDDDLPKGNLIHIARAAGMLAAKKTPDLLPHCHPLTLDHLEISLEVIYKKDRPDLFTDNFEQGVLISVLGECIARTGLEMEVLTAVTVAGLTTYDLLKPIDKTLEIGRVRLTHKSGGKSDKRWTAKSEKNAALLYCSYMVKDGHKEDTVSGPVSEMLAAASFKLAEPVLTGNEAAEVNAALDAALAAGPDLLIVAGGTGLAAKDSTPDIVGSRIEKEIPGMAEAMRSFGGERTPLAMYSRTQAGFIGDTLVITIPGSSGGATESLQAVLPGIHKVFKMVKAK